MIVNTNGLAPNFFDVMELPLALGRAFTSRDDNTAPGVAIVNQAFVRIYHGGENPLGKSISIGPSPEDTVDVVGVAANAMYTDLRGGAPATIYLPALQRLDSDAHFALRVAGQGHAGGSGDQVAVFSAIRNAVRSVDPALPVLNLRTQDEQIDRLHGQEHLFARLSGFFGLLSLALACVGLYGLVSHAIVRRTSEIGLRVALGALPGHVLRLILRESLTLVVLGVLAGAAAAYASGRLLSSMLFGLSFTDPVTYGSVALILVALSMAAALLPARRASRIDPIVALRTE